MKKTWTVFEVYDLAGYLYERPGPDRPFEEVYPDEGCPGEVWEKWLELTEEEQ